MFYIYNPDKMNESVKINVFEARWKRRQRSKTCSGYSWRRQYFHNINQARRIESMLKNDEEYKKYCKEYHIQPNILNRKDMPKEWWDEKSRRNEGNWKSQYKANRQYNIRTSSKNSKTIRRYEVLEDYMQDCVDEMLEEEFYEEIK